MIFSLKLSKNQRPPWLLVSKTRMHQLLENIFILSLRQDHFSSFPKRFFGRTLSFLIFKKSDSSAEIEQKWPYQTPLVARFRDKHATTHRMQRHSEKMFMLNLRKDHFCNWTIKYLVLNPPFLVFKSSDIITQI